MARPLRIAFPGAYYHITSRGNERKAIFKSKRDREQFLRYLETATERYGAVIHAFCLMDNHYHLLVETPCGNLSQIMRHINGAYTTYFNVRHSRSGHLFQGRYKAILVEKDPYAKVLSRYMHLNPVRAQMVDTPGAYAWSSYNDYSGARKAPQWLRRDFILGYFGKDISAAEKRYGEFVLSLVSREYESPLTEVSGSVLLGTPAYIESIKDRYMRGKTPTRDLPALGKIVPRIALEDVIETVRAFFGERSGSDARAVEIFLCRKHTGEKLKTIGAQFGISDSAVSQVCKRFGARLGNNKELRRQIERIENKIKMSDVET